MNSTGWPVNDYQRMWMEAKVARFVRAQKLCAEAIAYADSWAVDQLLDQTTYPDEPDADTR